MTGMVDLLLLLVTLRGLLLDPSRDSDARESRYAPSFFVLSTQHPPLICARMRVTEGYMALSAISES